MAPKKKKKPATNPARGFATTSVPSKSKAVVITEDEPTASEDQSVTASKDVVQPASIAPASATSSNGAPTNQTHAIQNMTPEELEAHLENSELEMVLEKHGQKVLADSRRHVSKLETERRQLRLQTHKLSTYTWLNSDTIDELSRIEPNRIFAPSGIRSQSTRAGPVDKERLSVDLWTLKRVFQGLNLPRVPEALAFVAELSLTNRLSPTLDSLPGLSEALLWYTSQLQPEEVLDYEQSFTTEREQRGDDLAAPYISGTEPTSATPSGPSPNSTPARLSEAEDESAASAPSSESDEDADPAKLTQKYLRIKRHLWTTQNSEFNVKPQTPTRISRRIDRLNGKLKSIKQDPLFDEYEAEAVWVSDLLELQEEQQQHMRAAAAQRRKQNHSEIQKTSMDGAGSEDPTHGAVQAEDGEDVLLGDMFSSNEDGTSVDTTGTTLEASVTVLDLGKWTGLAPRRLLEELCKGHDSRCGIQTRVLSQTSYSVRHRLEITWSIETLPDPHAVTVLNNKVNAQISGRLWKLEMISIAAANVAQSEAYISTLALSLLSTVVASASRATSRLPTIWRDLLKDLDVVKQEFVLEEHKTALRELRSVIDETQERLKQLPAETVSNERSQLAIRRKGRHGTRRTPSAPFSQVEVVKEWNIRTSNPLFQQMLAVREQLPVHQYKGVILSCIAANPVSIVCAETGAGKSSGIPVLLLEQRFAEGQDCRMLVTQPRRISAITLARRVSQELGESRNDIGTVKSLVGYAIRMESKTSSSTRITYATTGVLLRMLEESPDLDELDVLLLDEVHERSLDLDLLFIALKKLQQRRSSLKIVLMSATVDAKKFSDYFGGAPILDLPGRTFPVEVGYLEDAVEATNDLAGVRDKSLVLHEDDQDVDDLGANEKGKPILTDPQKYSSQTQRTLANMDEYRIDYNLIARLAACIATKPQFSKYSKAILIFMPGIGEMRRLHSLLLSMDTFNRKWVIHLLHSTFSTEDLERAFERPPPSYRKIVIATNIAETGITIPDVTAVIDTCKEKIMRFDERRQLSRLSEGFISRSSARQRRGRAARVQDGLCFHLVTKHRHDNMMLEQQVPEMLRLSLQDPMLRIKVWDLGSIEETLNEAIDPPSRKNIFRAIEKLKDAGALTKSEELTPLGQQISRLPLEVTLAKLAIFGVIFRCLDSILAIIALLTSKSPFLTTSAGQGPQSDARHALSRGDSDLLSSLNAYEGWKKAKAARSGQEFCRKNHISDQAMGQIEEQKIQLLIYLVDAGLVSMDQDERAALNRARNYHGRNASRYDVPQRYNNVLSDRALNAIFAMALYPRILTREAKGWRNVYTNQFVSLTSRSVNHASHTPKPPRWLSYYEAIQNTRTGNLNVFETSGIPESALAMLLGSDAEFKFYAGVMIMDSGKIKLSVRKGRELMAIKILRENVQTVLARAFHSPGMEMVEEDRQWLDLWLRIEVAQET